MNALVTTTMPLNYAEIERLGAAIAKSGLFGIRTPEQAVALMMIAHAEGRHPALAARDYHVIQGRPSKTAEAMLRDFLDGGGKVEWHALTDDKAEATFTHPAGGKVRIGWDIGRANKAGLAGKDMWKKFPRQMLRSRTISEGVRTVWPMATSGLYEPGEVSDFTGPTIEATPEPSARDKLNAAVPLHPQMPTGPVDPNPVDLAEPQPQKMTWTQLLKSFELAISDAESADEITRILQSNQMVEAKAHISKARSEHQQRFEEIMILADARRQALQETTPQDDDDEAPAIVGEELVNAG